MEGFCAIILAAGASRRFGSDDKLLAEFQGKALLKHVLEAVPTSSLLQTIVVVRPDHKAILPLVDDRHTLVINPNPERGLGSSIAQGVAALKPCRGVFIVLGDMPLVEGAVFETLAAHFQLADIVVAQHDDQNGHPVLFGRTCFETLSGLAGDVGAKALIKSGAFRVKYIPLTATGIVQDIDTLADLQGLKKRFDPK